MSGQRAGAVFSRAVHGDLRSDLNARQLWALAVGAPRDWATVNQVQGDRVVEVERAGMGGAADAMFTTEPELGLAVFTADCAGVGLLGDRGVGVAHAGWRGALAGVVPNLLEAMAASGIRVSSAVIGPTIGPCCFEVGKEVAARFAGYVTHTSWGTTSVDLPRYLADQLGTLVEDQPIPCTYHDSDYLSHRRTGNPARMAAVVWRFP